MRLSYPNTLPAPAGAGHQRTESTSTGCIQWLSLAKIALNVPLPGRNRSLVAITNMCGEDISPPHLLGYHCEMNDIQLSTFHFARVAQHNNRWNMIPMRFPRLSTLEV
jgi:hypothetical protein